MGYHTKTPAVLLLFVFVFVVMQVDRDFYTVVYNYHFNQIKFSRIIFGCKG